MGHWSSRVDRPLKVLRKFDHHSRSLRTSELIRTRWALCRSTRIVLKIWRRKTRPPLTTLAAHKRRPARDWSWRIVKRFLQTELWSSCFRRRSFSSGRLSVMEMELSSIPRKVMCVVGSTAFPQCIMKPSFRRSCIRMFNASAQTCLDFEIIKKSSK